MSEPFKLTTIDLPPEAFAKFWDAVNNPKPPTQALIDLMKSASPWEEFGPPLTATTSQ